MTARRFCKAVLLGGAMASAIDILAASAIYHIGPDLMLKAVAGGVLGRPAFAGGTGVILLGLSLQFLIGIVAALFYCLAALRIDLLLRRYWLCGLGYGAVCNLVMTFIVLPLSHAKPPPLGSFSFAANFIANTLLFGTPIAFAAWRVLRRSGS